MMTEPRMVKNLRTVVKMEQVRVPKATMAVKINIYEEWGEGGREGGRKSCVSLSDLPILLSPVQ